MAIAASGAVSLSDFRTEFVGGSGAISLGDLYRGGSNIRAKAANNTSTNLAASVPTSGAIGFGDFHGAAKGFRKTYSETATNQNASSVFGDDYGVDYPKEIVINSGVELGATSTSEEALQADAGLVGSLTITNNGTLTGAGGAVGAAGGDAFEANVACTLVNNGTIRAGGGGGGNGGTGGQGRTSYTSLGSNQNAGIYSNGQCNNPAGGNTQFYLVSLSGNGNSNGRGAWYNGSCYQNSNKIGNSGTGNYNVTVNTYVRSVAAGCLTNNWDTCGNWGNMVWRNVNTNYNYHSGGSGGSGGVGQGYGQASSSGSGGSAGGTNAGAGGSGGSGGGYGASGSSGNSGGNGNYTNGSAGGGGGAAGNYIRGLSNVTLTNNGTVQGGTA